MRTNAMQLSALRLEGFSPGSVFLMVQLISCACKYYGLQDSLVATSEVK